MYWRLNCAEHLVLGHEAPKLPKPQRAPGLTRQRSSTYSGTSPTMPATQSEQMKWAMGPSGRLLAGISSQTVYLWQLQPFVLLSKLEYDEVDGSMVDVVWHPREHLLWVVLTSGQVYEVSVVGGSEQQQALEYRFRTEHYWAQGVGEEGGIRGRSMVHERTLLVEEHGSPLCALALPLDDGVQVATRSRIVRIAWDGLIGHTMVVGEVAEDPLAQLVCMVGVEQQRAYLFSDGSLWVHSADTGARSQLAAGHVATSVAYSAMSGILAVGTRAGGMLLFAEQAGLLRETRHLRGMQSSAITALAWSPDGHAIACAHRSGHVTVRSALGYELSTSRVRSPAWFLCWGRLRVFVMGHTADALPLVRASLGCAGAAAAAAAVASEATRVCLVSDDKLLLHDCGFGVAAPGDVAALQWRVVQMPGAYMAMWGWPPEHTAVSGDGLHVAVAGRRGLAVVSIKTGAWRLLRTRQQEASLRVSGLLWLGNHVVAACTVDGLPQLLFFARGSRGALDLDTAHAEALGGVAPLCVSCHDALLLVLCADLRVRQYDVFAQGDSLRVSFSRSVDVRGANVCWRRVRSLQWVPGARFDRRPMFLVHEGARLCVLDGLTQEVRVLAERAEHVIISGVHFGNMHSTVWWFTGSELCAALISLEDFMDGSATMDVRMHVRPEFYPVAIAADRGMAVGVDQDWTLEEGVVGLAHLPVRAKLYLPSVLERMLSLGFEQDALLYAACFEHLDFFGHAMEILLHESLEQRELLRRVVSMLENFQCFYEVVVHCARKTEAAFWPCLFECLGGSEEFFQRCLAAGKLETATQCLIILQTLLEGREVIEPNVLLLLRRVVEAENRSLCVEILRFIKMTAESDTTMRTMLGRLRGPNSIS